VATAKPGAAAQPVPVELWAVKPELGLALLRISPVDLAVA